MNNRESRIKKFQAVQKLQKFQNRILAGSLFPVSDKFQCTSLTFMRILWRHKGI